MKSAFRKYCINGLPSKGNYLMIKFKYGLKIRYHIYVFMENGNITNKSRRKKRKFCIL